MMSHETPPTTFPFVLTNNNGLKMHGAVLHVAEEIDSYQVGGMVSRALSNSRGYGSGGREGAVSGAHSPRAGVLLSPARLPTWLRDTVRGSSFLAFFERFFLRTGEGACYVQSQIREHDLTGEVESIRKQITIKIGSMRGM